MSKIPETVNKEAKSQNESRESFSLPKIQRRSFISSEHFPLDEDVDGNQNEEFDFSDNEKKVDESTMDLVSQSEDENETEDDNLNKINDDGVLDDYYQSEDFEDSSDSFEEMERRKRRKNPYEHLSIAKQEIKNSDSQRLQSLAKDCETIKDFISTKVYQQLHSILIDSDHTNKILPLPTITTQPAKLTNCRLRDYQLSGLEFLLKQYSKKINCILADEMGLGKTVQTIAFLAYLKYNLQLNGAFLIVVPLSVLFNWINELRKFCPSLSYLRVHANDLRGQEEVKKDLLNPKKKYDVILTTYEMLKSDYFHNFFQRIQWRTVILDEGHRLKNDQTNITKSCMKLHCEFKIVLTGTPLQNNLHELGVLLQFLAPNIFKELVLFDSAFDLTVRGKSSNKTQIDRNLLDKAHYLCRLFLLRRIKQEVEQTLPHKYEIKIDCPMSKLQLELTQFILFQQKQVLQKLTALQQELKREQEQKLLLKNQENKDNKLNDKFIISVEDSNKLPESAQEETLNEFSNSNKVVSVPDNNENSMIPDVPNNSSVSKSSTKQKLFASKGNLAAMTSLFMLLRHVANHPYNLPNIEDINFDGSATEDIVSVCGKFQVLDKLLANLLERNHRVVLFSQYIHMLDIICDYLDLRKYRYTRLDGSTHRVMREVRISLFNQPDSEFFIFCLTTRAGGEGINLTSADTVILFDSDWNPQVDIQAMARVHRIGQTKPVHIYRLVTKGSIEEVILKRAQKKLFLDSMVNRGSTAKGQQLDIDLEKATNNNLLDLDNETSNIGQKRLSNSPSDANEYQHSKKRKLSLDLNDEELPDGFDPSTENQQEDNLEQTSKIFSALKFGWNAVFAASSDGLETGLSDENFAKLIDRKALETIPASKEAMCTGNQVKDLIIDQSDSKTSKISLLTTQEASLDSFDENAPLLNIENISLPFLTDNSIPAYSPYSEEVAEEDISFEDSSRKLRNRQPKIFQEQKKIKSNAERIIDSFKLKTNRMNHSELNNIEPSLSLQHGRKQVAGRDYSNQDYCQECWEGGDLLCCDNCPTAFHIECIGLKKIPKSTYLCPHHQCISCRKGGSNFYFRCTICPVAFCEECLPRESKLEKDGNCKRFLALGYRPPSNAVYIRCSKECIEFDEEETLKKIAEEHNEEVEQELTHSIDISTKKKDIGTESYNNKNSKYAMRERKNQNKIVDTDDDEVDEEEVDDDDEDDDDESSEENKFQESDVLVSYVDKFLYLLFQSNSGYQNLSFDINVPSTPLRLHLSNAHKYDPFRALISCTLPDVKARLFRSELLCLPLKSMTYFNLLEIPRFDFRYRSMALSCKELLIQILFYIQGREEFYLQKQFKEKNKGKNFTPTKHSPLKTVQSPSQEQNFFNEDILGITHKKMNDFIDYRIKSQDGSSDRFLEFLEDNKQLPEIFHSYRGLSDQITPENKVRIFSEAVQTLGGTIKNHMIPQITKCLGLSRAILLKRYTPKPDETKEMLISKTFYSEPKFSFSVNSYSREEIFEAIIAFLLVLTPMNMILPSNSKESIDNQQENNGPSQLKTISGIFHCIRLSQALFQPVFDPNQIYFIPSLYLDFHGNIIKDISYWEIPKEYQYFGAKKQQISYLRTLSLRCCLNIFYGIEKNMPININLSFETKKLRDQIMDIHISKPKLVDHVRSAINFLRKKHLPPPPPIPVPHVTSVLPPPSVNIDHTNVINSFQDVSDPSMNDEHVINGLSNQPSGNTQNVQEIPPQMASHEFIPQPSQKLQFRASPEVAPINPDQQLIHEFTKNVKLFCNFLITSRKLNLLHKLGYHPFHLLSARESVQNQEIYPMPWANNMMQLKFLPSSHHLIQFPLLINDWRSTMPLGYRLQMLLALDDVITSNSKPIFRFLHYNKVLPHQLTASITSRIFEYEFIDLGLLCMADSLIEYLDIKTLKFRYSNLLLAHRDYLSQQNNNDSNQK